MTRKDYIEIANVLRRFKNMNTDKEATTVLIHNLSDYFVLENNRFDKDKFIKEINKYENN